MFAHEQLDVYQCALEFVEWSSRIRQRLNSMQRNINDQLQRAEESILLNIAEGNGKRRGPDRRRYLESARASAGECAAAIDILRVTNRISESQAETGKELLDRIAGMLTKMIK
ncbi:four helix bundle protein [bacterium]|nr:four helix bundle protein [bacterium]